MQIREANNEDIPKIVELLKFSLGEKLMPKTSQFWNWKHNCNPFGASYVLVAFNDEKLIGVRAFMRWDWRIGNQIYKSVRAVDTAVHPQYQGKGIFSKLTKQLVEECTKNGIHFIYNTPNGKSRPGYLKLGWRIWGNLMICLIPRINLRKKDKDFDLKYKLFDTKQLKLVTNINEENFIVTDISEAYLHWRYIDNPNEKYYCFINENEGFTIFRLKKYFFGLEMRLCEVIGNYKDRNYRQTLRRVAKEAGAHFITTNIVDFGVPGVKLKLGPIITIRNLSSMDINLNLEAWKPSIGDIEFF